MSLAALAEQVRSGEISATERVQQSIDTIEGLRSLNLVCWMDPDMALIQARSVDSAVASGRDPGPLAGVPVAIKDNLAFAGAPLECCSPALKGYCAPDNATVVQRLMDAGAVIVARTNMDEFAMGSSTERSVHGASLNPRDPSRVCGGSSGGSAGLVAAGGVPLALGSSTGGSVCQPASHCGVVGLEPTWGRLSRNGLVAFSSSMDRVGLFTGTVEDAALVLSVLEGRDPLDATSLDRYEGPQSGLRVTLLEQGFEGVDPEVERAVRAALGDRPSLSLPLFDQALACYTVLSSAEAASNLARFDGIGYAGGASFGPEAKRRILFGTHVLRAGTDEAWVERARSLRRSLQDQLDTALEQVDVLALPVTPQRAFPLGSLLQDPVSMQAQDRLTALAGLTGNPAISVPCSVEGLPIGLQLIGRRGQETALLQAAALLQ